ncbi:MAG: 2Fe-2S iron-sulfur cluster binding domain-containing protein [Desulfobacula sp.]|nr:2Fe-2S iron-sulfur cluster binding domain-containing protein [Desulfobacula sp.]
MIGSINGKQVEFNKNQVVLTVAKANNHFIPTLCEMADLNHTPGTCRVCLVDIQKKNDSQHRIVTACTTPMEEGMSVLTRTPKVRQMQRLQVELLIADHNQDCAACIRHGNCELQDVAQFVGLKQTRYTYPQFYQRRSRDDSSPAVVRDMSKCIRCFRCVAVCRDIQGIDALVITEKGLETEISVRDHLPLNQSDCVSCGQCILVCPVGALAEKNDIEAALDLLFDPELVTVVQFAPAIRTAIGEEFNMTKGENLEGKIITALKQLGADVVLDTNFTADLVIMEEGTELLERIKNKGVLPMFTSCCPGWVNFVEKNYPDMREHISTTRSPQQALGSMAKTYLAQKMGLDPSRIRVISIMPCTAKKGEANRPEFKTKGFLDVDVVLTTRELARLLKREGMDLADLPDSGFDSPWMSDYSGAAVIFGNTGGVMEAAVRTVYKVATGKELATVEYTDLRGEENFREAVVDLGPDLGSRKLAVVHTLKAARRLLESIKTDGNTYDFVEVMACPGGCAGGGGQPRSKHSYQGTWQERKKGLYTIDQHRPIRQSHNNPMITVLYEDFLGAPMGETSHHLLHTTYRDRRHTIKHTMDEIWKEIEQRT